MKNVSYRRKLSAAHLNLPGSYRTTAWAEVNIEPAMGQNRRIEIARFHSSTPGHVEVFARQSADAVVSEISEAEFMRLITSREVAK